MVVGFYLRLNKILWYLTKVRDVKKVELVSDDLLHIKIDSEQTPTLPKAVALLAGVFLIGMVKGHN